MALSVTPYVTDTKKVLYHVYNFEILIDIFIYKDI